MIARRSFIAQTAGIVCGAVLGTKLGHDVGEMLPRPPAESESVIDLTGWTHYSVDPHPKRFTLVDDQWVEFFPYQQIGEVVAPNPEYVNAPIEQRLYYKQDKTGEIWWQPVKERRDGF